MTLSRLSCCECEHAHLEERWVTASCVRSELHSALGRTTRVAPSVRLDHGLAITTCLRYRVSDDGAGALRVAGHGRQKCSKARGRFTEPQPAACARVTGEATLACQRARAGCMHGRV